MKKIISFFALLLLTVPIMAQNASQYIPKDAVAVLCINAESYDKKVDMAKVLELDVFKAMDEQAKQNMQEKYDIVSKIYKAPSEAGVNLFPKSYAYGELIDSLVLFSYIFTLNDATKFEELLNASAVPMSSDQKIMQGKGFNYITNTSGGTMAICWTKNTAFVMGLEGGDDGMYDGLDFDDPDYTQKLEDRRLALNATKMKVLMDKATRITGVKESINANANFMAFDKETYDIGAWMNMGMVQQFMKEKMNTQPQMAMPGMEDMMQSIYSMYNDSYYQALLNFENGAADLKVRTYMPADMMAKYGKAYSGTPNPLFFKFINGKSLLGFATMSIDIKEVFAMVIDTYRPIFEQIPQKGSQVNAMLDLMGIALDEDALAGIFKGDALVAATDVREVEITYIDYEYDENYNMNKVEKTRKDVLPVITALATIGNKDNFMTIIKAMEAYGLMKKDGMVYKLTIPNASFSPTIAIQGDLLVISNDDQLLMGLAKGIAKGNQINASLQAEVLKHNQFIYTDITNAINKTIAMGNPPEKEKQLMEMLNTYLKDARLAGVDNKGTHFQYDFTLDMEDQKTNSAMQIFEMINKMYLMDKGE